jgi:superoxide reductase
MKKEPKFFICKHCGNVVTLIHESGAPLSCCGEKMTQIVPNTVDAVVEKHVPAVTVDGDKISVVVGSVEHPMVPEHFIQWICLETDKGTQIKYLTPEDKPKAVFKVEDETPVAVYEYCNLHGLWKKEI